MVDALKQEKGMTTQEAFNAVWEVFPNAEHHMPTKLQKVVLPAAVIGIRACMAIPACSAFFVALTATILYELGKAGHELVKMTKPMLDQVLESYQSGELEKSYENNDVTKTGAEEQDLKKNEFTPTNIEVEDGSFPVYEDPTNK